MASKRLEKIINSALEEESPKEKKQKISYCADFPELIDIVLQDNGETAYLWEDGKVTDEIEVNGVLFNPPPLRFLPAYMKLPRLSNILDCAQKHGDSGDSGDSGVCGGCTDLFKKLIEYHQNISELPDQKLYILLAAWDFHTYSLEKAEYSPIIYFFSIAERGKSRTLKGMTYVAYRGIRKTDVRDSQLIRDCTNLRATLAFDMTNFWESVKSSGSVDVILNRYERGTTVSRINRPEKGAFQDTDFYDVFGPTILATNEIISDIADTRSIPITMIKSDKDYETHVTPENSLSLKEELTAFRLLHKKDNWKEIDKPVKGRLGDIVRPLLEVVINVAPEFKDNFITLIKDIENTKLVSKASSLDSDILLVMKKLENNVIGGTLPNQLILDEYNRDKSKEEELRARKMSNLIKSFGFKPTRTSINAVGFFYDSKMLDRLLKEHGVPLHLSPETPETPVSPDLFEKTNEKYISPDELEAQFRENDARRVEELYQKGE